MSNDNKGYIFGAIFSLANRLQILGDKLDPKITIKQWLFIAVVMKTEVKDATISKLASLIGYSRQNVKKMAVILEKSGFIEFMKDDSDERILRLRVTPKCYEYFKFRENKEEEFIEKLFDGLSDDIINCLSQGLFSLEKNIIKMENENER